MIVQSCVFLGIAFFLACTTSSLDFGGANTLSLAGTGSVSRGRFAVAS